MGLGGSGLVKDVVPRELDPETGMLHGRARKERCVRVKIDQILSRHERGEISKVVHLNFG